MCLTAAAQIGVKGFEFMHRHRPSQTLKIAPFDKLASSFANSELGADRLHRCKL